MSIDTDPKEYHFILLHGWIDCPLFRDNLGCDTKGVNPVAYHTTMQRVHISIVDLPGTIPVTIVGRILGFGPCH
jgi:hypothetical protein